MSVFLPANVLSVIRRLKLRTKFYGLIYTFACMHAVYIKLLARIVRFILRTKLLARIIQFLEFVLIRGDSLTLTCGAYLKGLSFRMTGIGHTHPQKVPPLHQKVPPLICNT